MSLSATEPHQNGAPLYIQVQSKLRERIVAGRYPLSSLLPTEAELSEEFATSRHTIREALRLLVEQGLVRRRQGAGTVVISTAPSVSYVQSLASLQDLFMTARSTHYALHSIETVRLDAETAELIGGTVGDDWQLVTGVRWTEPGGTPLAYVESYIPKEFAEIVTTFPRKPPPFYAVLEAATGRTIDDVFQEIRAIQMPRRVAIAFGLAEGSTSMQLLRRYIARGSCLITSLNWHRADQFIYRMQIHRRIGGE